MACACGRVGGRVLLRPQGVTGVTSRFPRVVVCQFSTSQKREDKKSYKLLIVGGGTGGSAVANKFAKKLGKGQVAIIEPNETHYYQPMFTLVGNGLKKYAQTHKPMSWVLPTQADWLKDKATTFDPDNNTVTTQAGHEIKYEYLVVAMGLQLNFHLVKGLPEALEVDPQVCSNYSPIYVKKTWPAAQAFKEGNAIFTFPNTPIKCAGAPQKIAYLTEDYFTRSGKRDKAHVIYNTSLPVIFGIPRYAASLEKLVAERNIEVNKRTNLVEVRHETKEAIFELLDEPGKTETYKYGMLHVSPPMSTPEPLWGSSLVDATHFVDVDRGTLQHNKYKNVFAIGDCTNAPTAKTAAACAGQSGVLAQNLRLVMKGQQPNKLYDGYTSCPLTTTKDRCILAEFGYDGSILETFPIDQSKPRFIMFHMKANFMPHLYWYMLVKGMWNGPKWVRKITHLGMGN